MKKACFWVVMVVMLAARSFAYVWWERFPSEANANESYRVVAASSQTNVTITILKGGSYLAGGTGSPWWDEETETWEAFHVEADTSDPSGPVAFSASTGSWDTIHGTLEILHPPFVNLQPISRTLNLGANVTFEAQFGGGTPITYQWRKNGVNISGAAAVAAGGSHSLGLSQQGQALGFGVDAGRMVEKLKAWRENHAWKVRVGCTTSSIAAITEPKSFERIAEPTGSGLGVWG